MNIAHRVASLKAAAIQLLEEAINMEKELGLVEGPAPRKGLTEKQLSLIREKRNKRVQQRSTRK